MLNGLPITVLGLAGPLQTRLRRLPCECCMGMRSGLWQCRAKARAVSGPIGTTWTWTAWWTWMVTPPQTPRHW